MILFTGIIIYAVTVQKMKWNCFICLLILCSFFSLSKLTAQKTPDSSNELDTPIDTALFYKKLYDYSQDKKLLFMLYRSVFNPPVRDETTKKKKCFYC